MSDIQNANVNDLTVADVPGKTIVTTIKPVFFLFTASFWLGLAPGIAAALEFVFTYFAGPDGGPVAASLATVLSVFGADVTGEQISELIQKLSPLYLFLFAWQRGTFSGKLPRPYTADKGKADTVIRAVENGKTAFETGKEIGKLAKDALRR